MKKKHANGALLLVISAVILKGSSFLFRIFLADQLGDLGMGYFNAAYTVYTFFFLLCAGGVPKAVAVMMEKYEAKSGSETSEAESQNCFLTIRKTFLKISVSITLFLSLFSGFVARLIGTGNAALPILFIAPSVCFVTQNGVFRGLRMHQREYGVIAASDLTEGCARLLLGVVFARATAQFFGKESISAAAACLGISLASLFGLLVMKNAKKILISREKTGQNARTRMDNRQTLAASKRTLSDFFAIALPITLSGAVVGFSGVIDLSIVMRRLEHIGCSEAEAAALFGNYTTLVVPMFHLVSAVLSPLLVTMLSPLARASNRSVLSLKEELSEQLKKAVLLTAPCTFGYLFFADKILRLLFSEASVITATPLLAFLAPGVFLSSVLTVLNTALEASGKARASLYSVVVTSCVKLLASFALVGNPAFGIAGAPIGAVISYSAGLLVSWLLLKKQEVNIPLVRLSLPFLLCGAVSVFAARFLQSALEITLNDRFATMISMLSAAIFYFALLFCLEKKTMTEIVFCLKDTKKGSLPCE